MMLLDVAGDCRGDETVDRQAGRDSTADVGRRDVDVRAIEHDDRDRELAKLG
jgi:hypothetical protein